jgi:hypothetical protein
MLRFGWMICLGLLLFCASHQAHAQASLRPVPSGVLLSSGKVPAPASFREAFRSSRLVAPAFVGGLESQRQALGGPAVGTFLSIMAIVACVAAVTTTIGGFGVLLGRHSPTTLMSWGVTGVVNAALCIAAGLLFLSLYAPFALSLAFFINGALSGGIGIANIVKARALFRRRRMAALSVSRVRLPVRGFGFSF